MGARERRRQRQLPRTPDLRLEGDRAGQPTRPVRPQRLSRQLPRRTVGPNDGDPHEPSHRVVLALDPTVVGGRSVSRHDPGSELGLDARTRCARTDRVVTRGRAPRCARLTPEALRPPACVSGRPVPRTRGIAPAPFPIARRDERRQLERLAQVESCPTSRASIFATTRLPRSSARRRTVSRVPPGSTCSFLGPDEKIYEIANAATATG